MTLVGRIAFVIVCGLVAGCSGGATTPPPDLVAFVQHHQTQKAVQMVPLPPFTAPETYRLTHFEHRARDPFRAP